MNYNFYIGTTKEIRMKFLRKVWRLDKTLFFVLITVIFVLVSIFGFTCYVVTEKARCNSKCPSYPYVTKEEEAACREFCNKGLSFEREREKKIIWEESEEDCQSLDCTLETYHDNLKN
jgi:hypothetical protein